MPWKLNTPDPICPEHQHEARIPHEDITVKCRIDIWGYKAILPCWDMKIGECDLPGLPVTADYVLTHRPERLRQHGLYFQKFRRGTCVGFYFEEDILIDKLVFNMGVVIRLAIQADARKSCDDNNNEF